MVDRASSAEENPQKEVRYCPVCGSDVEPLFEFTSEKSVDATVECPEHGEIMVEYYEQD